MKENNEIWQLGNTTVRSAMRLRDGINALVEAQLIGGGIRGKDGDARFREVLGKAGVVKLGSDVTESVGRKWRSAMEKLGFLYPVVSKKSGIRQEDLGPVDAITPAGRRLVKAETVAAQQECFLRAMSVPLIRDRQGHPYSPLVWTLAILNELENRRQHPAINFFEMATIVQVSTPADGLDCVVKRLLELRKDRNLAGSKRQFDRHRYKSLAKEYAKNSQTFRDYADENIRYLKATGLVRACGRGITLVPEKRLLAQAIVAGADKDLPLLDRYRAQCKGASLPTDNKSMAMKVLKNQVERVHRDLHIQYDIDYSILHTAQEINAKRYEVEAIISRNNERIYAAQQASCWEEISQYMQMLEQGKTHTLYKADNDDDKDDEEQTQELLIPSTERPAYLEWILWRAFLAIDSLVNESYEVRNFNVDQDFLPVGTAPGGGPDLIAEFQNFVIVIEVTLSSNSRQEAMEGEPVRRHVADQVEHYMTKNKPVYGLFIANSIDSNTAETFRIGVWYNKQDKKLSLNITPITLNDFQQLFDYLFKNKQAKPEAILKVLKRCQTSREKDEAPQWKKDIHQEIEYYTRE